MNKILNLKILLLSAEFVFFVIFFFSFLSQAHKIIWVTHKLAGSVGNQNQRKKMFRPHRRSTQKCSNTLSDKHHSPLALQNKTHLRSASTPGGGGGLWGAVVQRGRLQQPQTQTNNGPQKCHRLASHCRLNCWSVCVRGLLVSISTSVYLW